MIYVIIVYSADLGKIFVQSLKYNIKIERSTMKTLFRNLLFDLSFITAMIFNYYNIFQPISGNLCKCIPVYLGFAIILLIVAIILIFSIYVFSTKEEVQKAIKDYKPTNKIYQNLWLKTSNINCR